MKQPKPEEQNQNNLPRVAARQGGQTNLVDYTYTNATLFVNLTTLPLTGSPKQKCRIEATTFLFIKMFLRTTCLKERLNFDNTTLKNAALKNAVRVERRVRHYSHFNNIILFVRARPNLVLI